MKPAVRNRYMELRNDYSTIHGTPFNYFFCPILFTDEDVELCKAHILNQAFSNTSRAWTIQRKDVDNFYGSRFESDFLAIEYKGKSPLEILSDKKLSDIFRPKLFLENDELEHYIPQESIPDNQSSIELWDDEQSLTIALKIEPEAFSQAIGKDLQIDTSKDLRLPALVSLIKAAHLTLFELIGYQYALNGGAKFVGHEILGKFFLQNRNNKKPETTQAAMSFFAPYTYMVRPVEISKLEFDGTITDYFFLACRSDDFIWAFIVFIKISKTLHAVIIPIFDDARAEVNFREFLTGRVTTLNVSVGTIGRKHFELNPKSTQLEWPTSTLGFTT
jgi:hypothetical protein